MTETVGRTSYPSESEPTDTGYRGVQTLAGPNSARHTMPDDPEWYKRAVFYEVLVRTFFDSNGDGTGDIKGLIEKLDYLAWLGVDCLWIPPFYDSPAAGRRL